VGERLDRVNLVISQLPLTRVMCTSTLLSASDGWGAAIAKTASTAEALGSRRFYDRKHSETTHPQPGTSRARAPSDRRAVGTATRRP
jgi:hypothetical protein